MRNSETSKFRLQFSLGFFFILLTLSAVLIAGYLNLRGSSSGELPDWKESNPYYRDYFQYEDKYGDRSRELTHSEMNEAIDIEYDSVRVVSDYIYWKRVDRKTGDKILSLLKSIVHEKRIWSDNPGIYFPNEFEVHYVRDEKLVLQVDIPLERDGNSIEVFNYEFKVPVKESKRFREISLALEKAKGLE